MRTCIAPTKTWMGECLHGIIENRKILMFFGPSENKIDSPRRRDANFDTWVTRLPIEMNVHVANMFWQVPQTLLASNISISNLSPLQGRRVNRLPCFSNESASFIQYERVARSSWSIVSIIFAKGTSQNNALYSKRAPYYFRKSAARTHTHIYIYTYAWCVCV